MTGCGHFAFAADDPLCAELGFGAAALRYAAAGFAVLPLEPGEKRPHRMLGRQDDGLGGVYRASTHAAVIAAWWRHDPAANIGVATGQRNGLAVLDLDCKNGQNGLMAWGGYIAANPGLGTWPGGPWCRTPSGGAHVWLRTSGPVRDRSSRAALMPGVDVRGDGGLVVAPPSVALRPAGGGLLPPGEHGGAGAGGSVALGYEWHGCPLCGVPWAPAWFGAALESWGNNPGALAEGRGSGLDTGAELPSVAELVAAHGFPPGERNDGMYRLACRLVRQQLSSGEAPDPAGELWKVWQASDMTSFRWSEVLVLLDSARRFMARQMTVDLERRRAWMGVQSGSPSRV